MHLAGPAPARLRKRSHPHLQRLLPVLGFCGLAALVLAGCGPGPSSSPDSGVGCSVTVSIPSFGGSLLGTVRASAEGHQYSFSRNVNTIPVGCGEQAQLSVSAADPASHPFTGWSGGKGSSASITVTVTGPLTISPAFRVPLASPSPSPAPSPSSSPSTVTLDQWVSYDAADRTVTWKLVAGAPSVNRGLNFDNEDFGHMKVTVPVGWTVTIDFSNAGTIYHSAAVVSGATSTTPVFAGATTPSQRRAPLRARA